MNCYKTYFNYSHITSNKIVELKTKAALLLKFRKWNNFAILFLPILRILWTNGKKELKKRALFLQKLRKWINIVIVLRYANDTHNIKISSKKFTPFKFSQICNECHCKLFQFWVKLIIQKLIKKPSLKLIYMLLSCSIIWKTFTLNHWW